MLKYSRTKYLLVLLLPFIFFSNEIGAQTQLVFIGTASVKDGDTYTYKIQATDSNGILKGYSITDIAGPYETKATLTGTFSPDSKQFNFRETGMINTKVKAGRSEFCYLQGHLKVSNTHGATTLKGHFNGYKEDGKTLCASGKIAMVSTQDILKKLLELKKEDSLKNAKKNEPENKIVYDYKEEQAIPESAVKKVKPGDTINLSCTSQVVTLDVWDAKTIDGDIITLLQDNKPLLENYTLTGTHRQITVSLATSPHSLLTLIAVSEGSEPLNTARIKIASGTKVYYIDATTTIGKNVVISLNIK